ncbi:AraC-type DNA-binding protein [Lachnospiraceae bacterium YSD2013]|jgi:AraC-like DNA-binding protein|nr:AraC-type DNA-binding protein [Lachnospiraceae bacterium YSD2013]
MNKTHWIGAFGRVYNPQDWFYNPNYLINRIYYIAGGKAFYKEGIPLKKGYLYVFGTDPGFRVYQDDSDPVDHAYFDFISFQSFLKKEITEIDLKKYPKLQHVILAMAEEFADRSCPMTVADSYFEIIMHELEKVLSTDTRYSEVTENALRIIHSCPPSEVSVQEVASKINVNVNYLIRRFNAEVGETPHKYISLMKAELAVKYIQGGRKLAEIAELLGYSSVSSLSFSFKSLTGRNLSEFATHSIKKAGR